MSIPEQLKERYDIGEMVGETRSGWLYQATQRSNSKQGVLRVLRPELLSDAAAEQRLGHDLGAQAALATLDIALPYDFGVEAGAAWVFRRWVEGETLAQRLAQSKSLPADTAIMIARKIASALDILHGAGLVHRDLKPSRVVIGDDDQVILLDPGIAALAGDYEGRQIAGTADYLAPEVASGRLVSSRADLYALGCVLYEMLCGVSPFRGESDGATIAAHVHGSIPVPEGEFADELKALVVQLLDKDPSKRPFSARRVAAILSAMDPLESTQRSAQKAAIAGLAKAPPPLPLGGEEDRETPIPSGEASDDEASADQGGPDEETTDRESADFDIDIDENTEVTRSPMETSETGFAEGATVVDKGVQLEGELSKDWNSDQTEAIDPDITKRRNIAYDPTILRAAAFGSDDEFSPTNLTMDIGQAQQRAELASAVEEVLGQADDLEDAQSGGSVGVASAASTEDRGSLSWMYAVMLLVLGVVAGVMIQRFLAPSAEDSVTKPPVVESKGDQDVEKLSAPPDKSPKATKKSTAKKSTKTPPSTEETDTKEKASATSTTETPGDTSTTPPKTAVSGEGSKEKESGATAAKDQEKSTDNVASPTATKEASKEPTSTAKPPKRPRPPRKSFSSIRDGARRAFNEGRYLDAEKAYLKAAQMRPKDSGVWAGLGAARYRLRKGASAAAAYREALKYKPRSANYWVALGRSYRMAGDTTHAVQAFERALQLDPTNPWAKKALGRE